MVGLAYAKVNLHLSVGPLRGDAFHSIVSIFQKIDLYDTIEIEVQEASEFSIEIEGINFPNSTIERAARLFSAESKISLKVKAKCTKRIPIQGGLGGGSSDGATTLNLLNTLTNYPLTPSQLISLGAQIGSDIPFFLSGAAAAMVTGRGEIVEPISREGVLEGILIIPKGEGVSTPQAYGQLDQVREEVPPLPKKEPLIEVYTKSPSKWSFANDFRLIGGPNGTLYSHLDQIVAEVGDCFGSLSGSGLAYAIFCDEREIVEEIRDKMGDYGGDITIIRIKSLHPDHSDVTVSV